MLLESLSVLSATGIIIVVLLRMRRRRSAYGGGFMNASPYYQDEVDEMC